VAGKAALQLAEFFPGRRVLVVVLVLVDTNGGFRRVTGVGEGHRTGLAVVVDVLAVAEQRDTGREVRALLAALGNCLELLGDLRALGALGGLRCQRDQVDGVVGLAGVAVVLQGGVDGEELLLEVLLGEGAGMVPCAPFSVPALKSLL
jgi:hypothetical protein